MMPDLGKYAFTVGAAYAVTLVLIAALVALTLWRGRVVRRQLAEAEARLAEGRS
ncbi:MAG: heme exporter protein CcmD [Paracoccaceae bacterium]